MELGFSVAAGPLSQISVSLFSVELAVQLATGAYGWWKARDRGQSMLGLVESKGCQISTTSTFNLLRYVDKRKDSLIRGVARNPDGILSCVTLPNASSASAGDHGLVCLRAVVCALMCFYHESTVVDILVGALPGTLYTSDQEEGDETIQGPLISSLRQYVKAAAVEEDSDDLRQKLLDVVDSLLPNVTGATSKDVFECDNFLESDVPNFIGALRWILTPLLKRDQRVYPTRSLKVWALALIMAQLGFEVAASMHAVSSKDDYEAYIENVGYQATYQQVILVTSNHGPTDPLNAHGGQRLSGTIPSPRIGSIRSIPWTVFRHLQENEGLATPKYLSEVWEFTFQYVFDLLEPARPGRGIRDLNVVLEFTPAALESFGGESIHTKLKHIDKKCKFWEDLQWLTFVTFHPLKRFATPKGKNSIWNEGEILSQFKDIGTEYIRLPDEGILDDWYITRAIVLATNYAVCCKWLYTDNESQSPLDTEIAFCPDFLRRGNLTPWISLGPFSTKLLPENRPAPGFWAELGHTNWFQLIAKVFSGVTKDPALEARAGRSRDYRDTSFQSVLGLQRNGIVLLPNLLLYPSGDSQDWFRYHIRVGQLMDLPLEEDGFVCAANKPPRTSTFKTWKPEPDRQHTTIDNLPLEMSIRIDPEPWWESNERTVIFRARSGGVVKAIFSPVAIFKKNHTGTKSDCKCTIPKSSIELATTVVVLRVSDLLLHQGEIIDTNYGQSRLPVVVQTGGDKLAQVLCLAVSNFNDSESVMRCIHCLEKRSNFSPLVLL